MAVGTSGTCIYNGVNFNSLYHTKVSARPILDEAERAVAYVEHTLEVDGYVVGTPTDTTMASLRKALTAVGGALQYQNKGYGDLVVNQPGGSVWDVKWGPVPELIEFIPLGGDCNAAKVTWRVTTRIPECDLAKYKLAVLALNYTVSFSIDQDGYTTRQIDGYLEIPLTRRAANDRSVTDTADRYRKYCDCETPLGFQRTREEFKNSADRRRLDFSLTDVETPNALPEGCSKVEAKQVIKNAKALVFNNLWHMTLDVTVTLARGVPKTEALRVFLLILADRTNLIKIGNALSGLGLGGKASKAAILPQHITFTDDIFGRSASFHITLQILGAMSLQGILGASRMWLPVAGTSYAKWRASLQALGGVRGWAGLSELPGDDVIVDLCAGGTAPALPAPNTAVDPDTANGGGGKGKGTAGKGGAGGGGTGGGGGIGFPPAPPVGFGFDVGAGLGPLGDFGVTIIAGLTPANSYQDFKIVVEYGEDSNAKEHKPQPQKGQGAKAAPKPADAKDPAALGNATGNALAPAGGAAGMPETQYQRPVAPTRTFTLSGYAVRLGYEPVAPQLDRVGGVKVVELSRQLKLVPLGALGGVQLFALIWRITYSIPKTPGSIGYYADPAMRTTGGETRSMMDDQG